ncbi:hypothetical protein FOS14_19500 [Skermania sp. ID1734]|uniref:hypothetical protein n=1 Tax=Skermania sp. ID1734 TaxID=2597516 RepID=UPI00117DF41A|nr:hypothetical protein [Skermania sp. ID1734]TSD94830.1 hypothetical protein FOS14_19500 [Skermania sp. ID1734]
MTGTVHDHAGQSATTTDLLIDAGQASGAVAPKQTKEVKEVPLYSEEERDHLQNVARTGGWKGYLSRKKLDNDSKRREDAQLRAELPVDFDFPMLRRSDEGYVGRGGGRMGHVRRPTLFRDTTAQVPGLYPFSVGANAALLGAPIGTHLETGQPVGFDGMSWFRAGELTAPSTITLGLNGFGKSTFGRRLACYDMAVGVRPMVMGDLKPDHAPMFHEINRRSEPEMATPPCQISEVGFARGKINPLAVGSFGRLIARLPEVARQAAEVELRRRQVTALVSLLEILGGERFAPHEENLVEAAINTLYRSSNDFSLAKPPLPEDVLRVIRTAPAALADNTPGETLRELVDASGAMGRTTEQTWDRYVDLTERLRQCLDLIVRGPFGTMFNAQTTNPIDTDALAVDVDISAVPSGDTKLRAAVLLTCWSDGFSAVEASHLLSDHKLEEPRLYDLFIDEFSLVLGIGHGMVYRTDEITRVQRTIGTGTNFFTHTIKDFAAFDSFEDRNRAMGFFDRARAKVFFPLPRSEAELLDGKVSLNNHEINSLAEWASAPRSADDPVVLPLTEEEWASGERRDVDGGGLRRIPPGMGKCLIKTGEGDQPGIPVQMHVPPTERQLGFHNTSKRFDDAAKVG